MAQSIKDLILADFSGGLNTRDAASELSSNEFPLSLNVTIDERGAAGKRLGYERRFLSAVGSGLVSNMFWWGSRGLMVEQIGTGTHVGNGASFKTWTTSARIGMCEFNGNLVMNHPVDGMFQYDGTTVTAVATAPKGDSVAVWQNRLWSNDVTNAARVWYSDIGAFTYPVNNFNTLREKDTKKVTCLTGASGVDISGRPGLLAFKEDSAYRIYDSNTGAYTTIDTTTGTGSNIGAVSAYGRVYVASPRGVFWTDGINPLREATSKIENFFTGTRINQLRPDLYAAGRYMDRLWFSYPRATETANSIAFEHRPSGGGKEDEQGWVVPHSCAASCYAMPTDGTEMVMGSPSTNGLVFNFNKTGGDDGANIASYIQTRWLEPNYGNLTRVRRLRFVGYGSFQAAPFKDYESAGSLPTKDVDISQASFDYDAVGSTYDAPGVVYGPVKFQEYQDFWSIGVFRALSVYISETSAVSNQGREVIGSTANEVGAWGIAHINAMAIELGNR